MSVESSEILEYWFGILSQPEEYPHHKQSLWFGKSEEVDKEVEERFGTLLALAAAGELDEWKCSPRSCLSLVILFDQFSRHIYRGTPEAFSFDAKARALVLEAIEKGWDKQLYFAERAFFYLPLEHAEDGKLQQLSVEMYEQLLAEGPSSLGKELQANLDYAVQHKVIIDRFGRFPHRNEILGRVSTAEEEAFLKEPGSSF